MTFLYIFLLLLGYLLTASVIYSHHFHDAIYAYLIDISFLTGAITFIRVTLQIFFILQCINILWTAYWTFLVKMSWLMLDKIKMCFIFPQTTSYWFCLFLFFVFKILVFIIRLYLWDQCYFAASVIKLSYNFCCCIKTPLP